MTKISGQMQAELVHTAATGDAWSSIQTHCIDSKRSANANYV